MKTKPRKGQTMLEEYALVPHHSRRFRDHLSLRPLNIIAKQMLDRYRDILRIPKAQ